MDIKTVNKTMNNHQVNRNVAIGIKTIIIGAHWLQIGRWYIPTSINRERYPILLLESILIRLTTQLWVSDLDIGGSLVSTIPMLLFKKSFIFRRWRLVIPYVCMKNSTDDRWHHQLHFSNLYLLQNKHEPTDMDLLVRLPRILN